jgi:hypothetical protein
VSELVCNGWCKPGQATVSGREQPRTSVWTTSVTILEGRFGLQIMAAGNGRSLLMQAFETLTRSGSGWLPWMRPLLNRPGA